MVRRKEQMIDDALDVMNDLEMFNKLVDRNALDKEEFKRKLKELYIRVERIYENLKLN